MEVPDILYKYDNIIKDQHEKGIIERVDEMSKGGERKRYTPHHAVFIPDAKDASTKRKKTNLSLNEFLYRGTIIFEDLMDCC